VQIRDERSVMPGVVITTGAVSGPTAPGRAPASTFFVVGQAERGPVDRAVRIGSMAEFARIFGAATAFSTLHDSLATFFQEGGSRAYVTRVVGDTATTGALTTPLQDRATSPVATLSVAASSAGAWSSRVSIKVLDGATTGTFRVQVLLDDVVVEDYGGLRSPAEAVARINTSAAASNYIRLTNLASASTVPTNNPAVVDEAVSLTAGDDKRSTIVAADYIAALDLFTDGYGDGAVAIPGLGDAVHDALIAHADTFNRIALLSSARSTDKATLLSTAGALDAPRAGLFAPWIVVPDGSGGSKAISPEAYVAACRARAHDATGPWRAAAGEIAKARWVLAPDQVFTATDAADLDAGKVNVIVSVAAAVRNYGWRSLSEDTANWRFLSSADLINRVVTQARALMEPYVFSAIDDKGHLLAAIAGTLEGLVKPIADLGGLFGWVDTDAAGNPVVRDPGYKVVVDSSINSRSSLADNQVFAQLGLRPSPTAALVYLTVTKASVTAAL
jgi:hypothetical protein